MERNANAKARDSSTGCQCRTGWRSQDRWEQALEESPVGQIGPRGQFRHRSIWRLRCHRSSICKPTCLQIFQRGRTSIHWVLDPRVRKATQLRSDPTIGLLMDLSCIDAMAFSTYLDATIWRWTVGSISICVPWSSEDHAYKSDVKAIFSTTWIRLRRGHCRSLPFAVPRTAFWAPDPVPNAEIDVQDLAGYDNRLAVDRRLIVPCYTPWSSIMVLFLILSAVADFDPIVTTAISCVYSMGWKALWPTPEGYLALLRPMLRLRRRANIVIPYLVMWQSRHSPSPTAIDHWNIYSICEDLQWSWCKD